MEMIDDWEPFENSPDFYKGDELPHHFRFTQLKEETTRFLNDLHDFTRDYNSYSHHRNIYLKIHAPHLYLFFFNFIFILLWIFNLFF